MNPKTPFTHMHTHIKRERESASLIYFTQTKDKLWVKLRIRAEDPIMFMTCEGHVMATLILSLTCSQTFCPQNYTTKEGLLSSRQMISMKEGMRNTSPKRHWPLILLHTNTSRAQTGRQVKGIYYQNHNLQVVTDSHQNQHRSSESTVHQKDQQAAAY